MHKSKMGGSCGMGGNQTVGLSFKIKTKIKSYSAEIFWSCEATLCLSLIDCHAPAIQHLQTPNQVSGLL